MISFLIVRRESDLSVLGKLQVSITKSLREDGRKLPGLNGSFTASILCPIYGYRSFDENTNAMTVESFSLRQVIWFRL
ncbi:hypothetical protein TWF225_007316 [Orbilia oligospora]|uniref:Uncharacterized protein n=1 Tax=Orbilia oligospora TaxID=2813651 RepID=A0A8H2E5D0_ORBOL|nr:hypothetical protein TWF225_007316 [Orbilia oligospora]TGJ72101.1 hypothetical protein EYR41_004016 [Orbilia oligospora]